MGWVFYNNLEVLQIKLEVQYMRPKLQNPESEVLKTCAEVLTYQFCEMLQTKQIKVLNACT